MAESTNRCPLCDKNILLPFRKRLSETEFDHVVVCANQRCKAMLRLLPGQVMQLVSCDDPEALKKYPTPLAFAEWFKIWQQTHARRGQA